MASQLPVEIWHGIFLCLTQKDLAIISLVSKKIHQLVEPLLYSEFCWIPDTKYVFSWIPKPYRIDEIGDFYPFHARGLLGERALVQPPPRVHFFLRTILNQPHLGSHVRSLRFMAPLSPSGETKDFLPFWGPKASAYPSRHTSGFTANEMMTVLTLMEELLLDPSQEWREGFQSGRCDIVIALILYHLPNIASLEVRLRSHFCEPPIIGSAIHHVLTSHGNNPKLPKFEALKTVSYTLDRDEHGFDWDDRRDMDYVRNFSRDVAPLFELSGIEFLSLDWLAVPDTFWLGTQPRCLCLTTVRLRDGHVDENMLKVMLYSTPCLRTLECDLFSNLGLGGQACSAKVLFSAIDQVHATLEHLEVNFETYNGDEVDGSHKHRIISGTVGSMKHFRQLRYLELPIYMVMRPTSSDRLEDVLPDQLETLVLPFWPDMYKHELGHVETHRELNRYLNDHSRFEAIRLADCSDCMSFNQRQEFEQSFVHV